MRYYTIIICGSIVAPFMWLLWGFWRVVRSDPVPVFGLVKYGNLQTLKYFHEIFEKRLTK